MDRLNFFTKKFMKKINKDNFKKTLSGFATGITVVATKYNSILYGKTINSFSSLSLSPPLVLFSLDIKSSKLNIFKKCETITINILSHKQKVISNNFAKKNPDWQDVDYHSLKNGNPKPTMRTQENAPQSVTWAHTGDPWALMGPVPGPSWASRPAWGK